MHAANMFVRRIFAWPLIVLGAVIVEIGGTLIRLGAWTIDVQIPE